MAEVNFKFLQNLHESLLQKQQKISEKNQQEFTKEVRTFIEQAKQGGRNIASTRERDQIRANLRYWANYIYSVDKTFPDTELAPSSVTSSAIPASTILILVIIGIVIFVLAGFRAFARNGISETETPSSIPPTFTSTATISVTSQAPINTPTPESSGFNVILSSPENGDDITPLIEFNGIYDNLQSGWAIHVLFIKDGKYFPIREYYSIPEQPTTNNWTIQTQLVENSEELSKAQNYSFVLAISLDDASREMLFKSSTTGIDFELLPPTVITFKDTNTIIYRKKGYAAILGTRLVYPVFDGSSYDLFTSNPDGSDIRQITFTRDVDEKSPNLSADGTKIVYIQVKQSTNVHSIHIMDSNGENDFEIINGEKNVLEQPQWSPDSAYILYTLGDTSGSSNVTYWSIHTYQLLTGDDKNISGEPQPHILNRYHSWMPNSKDIVFNAGTARTGTSGFVKVSVNSPDVDSLFFDTTEQEVQPSIGQLQNGYLLTYTVIDPNNFSHTIYAVRDSNEQVPFDGSPVRLTKDSGGADYPILQPDSKAIYYIREGNIYKVEFSIEGGKIILIQGTNIDDGEYYGDLVVKTAQVSENPSFDINFMDTYFPIP